MPGKILGLDISEASITAVQVTSGLKTSRVTACARVGIDENNDLTSAMKSLSERMDINSDVCISSIPGEYVLFRNLRMPFKDEKKIRQTLPFEIESMVPLPVDDLIIDFNIADRTDQTDILVVSVNKSYISEFLEQLQACGIDPDVLDVRCIPVVVSLLKQEGIPGDGLFLNIEKKITMVIYLNKSIALIRVFACDGDAFVRYIAGLTNGDDTGINEEIELCFNSFCQQISNTIHAFEQETQKKVNPEKIFFSGPGALYSKTGDLLSRFFEIPADPVDLSMSKRVLFDENISETWNPALMNGALALALRDGKHGRGFNFRKDEFEITTHYAALKKDLKKVAVFLLVVMVCLIADLGVDYYYLKKRYVSLNNKITQVFKAALPDVRKIVDPVQQMRVKINEIRDSAISLPGINQKNKVVDLLEDISQRVPRSISVHVNRMVIDPDSVSISGNTDTFNTVDNIKNGLESSPLFNSVTISSANLDRAGKHVRFEIKMQRSR